MDGLDDHAVANQPGDAGSLEVIHILRLKVYNAAYIILNAIVQIAILLALRCHAIWCDRIQADNFAVYSHDLRITVAPHERAAIKIANLQAIAVISSFARTFQNVPESESSGSESAAVPVLQALVYLLWR